MMVAANYYDGLSAKTHKVVLSLEGNWLTVSSEAIDRRDPLVNLRISEPMGAAPRLIQFQDGAHCEVYDHAGFTELLAGSSYRDSWVVRIQRRWRWAIVAVVISTTAIAAGYRWGLPTVAGWLAFQMPEQLLTQLGDGTLEIFDRGLFSPSELPETRRKTLTEKFTRLASPGDAKSAYRLVYRNSTGIGANACALPDGTIVMTDPLVELADNDEEILAVLAHELGHLDRRHSLRMLIQSSIVGVVVAWYVGDVSNIAAGLPSMLLSAGYSREHEREADEYAAAMLTLNNISPTRLGDILAKLETVHGSDADAKGRNIFDYLSSHPATRERIEALRGGAR